MPSSTKRPAASQAEKFKAAAKEHGADQNEARWEKRLKKVAKANPVKAPD